MPADLSRTALGTIRLLAIGSCFLQDLLQFSHEGFAVDFLLANETFQFPPAPPHDIGSYDYQVVQIPLRVVIRDEALSHLHHDDRSGFEAAFGRSRDALQRHLECVLQWNATHGTPTLVMNFMEPQFASFGRFQSRFDLSDIGFFVRKLNEEMATIVRSYRSVYVLDVDRLAASFGRRYIQDDSINAFNHNAVLPPELRAQTSMNDPGPLSDTYDLSPGAAFRSAVVEELRAMHRTIRQLDAVKLVIVDLDDTAWIGVSGDAADIGPHMVEGWPGGIIEALHYVRRRGVLLAIASKNDEERIRSIWSSIVGPLLRLDDFAAVRINWRPKHDNVREILAETKVLCDNAVFIDDNPAERARVAAEFPDIRTLGSNPFELRRILLLAPEFQVSDITPESIARTPMVQSQIHRDAEQASLSTDDFARQQGLKIRIFSIRSERHPRFRRCLELVNKTNQFNTTGRRWQAEQFQAFFRQGGFLAAYEAEDRYTPYGLVGAAVLVDSRIQQWIESCRVIGFGVECAVLSAVVKAWRAAGAGPISADLVRTSINQPCHTLFEEAGFEASGSTWVLAENRIPPSVPYVTVEVQAPFP